MKRKLILLSLAMLGFFSGVFMVVERALAKTYTVRIENMRFNPAQISAEPGDTIVWENHDSVPHRLRRRDIEDPTLDSGTLDPGEAFSFRVRGATSVLYMDRRYPKMKGSIDIVVK